MGQDQVSGNQTLCCCFSLILAVVASVMWLDQKLISFLLTKKYLACNICERGFNKQAYVKEVKQKGRQESGLPFSLWRFAI